MSAMDTADEQTLLLSEKELSEQIPHEATDSTELMELKLSKLTTDGILVAIGLTIPLIAWFYIPFGGHSHWFARCGAIMAIIGIMLESRLFISKIMMIELAKIRGNRRQPGMYRFAMSKFMAMLSHLILISGAVISGYGDLIFSAVKFGDMP